MFIVSYSCRFYRYIIYVPHAPYFFSLTSFSAMFIWSPKSFVVGRLFLYWPVSRFARKSKAKSDSPKASQGGLEMSGGVVCKSKRSLRSGDSPSPAVWSRKSSKSRLLAKAVWVAWVRRADQRAMYACAVAVCKAAGAARQRVWASCRMKLAASVLHRPPTSNATTTSLQRPPRRSSVRRPRLQRWSLHAAVGVAQRWWGGTPRWYLLRVGPHGAMVGHWLWPQCGGCRNDQPMARSSQRAMCEWCPGGCPFQRPPPDSAKPPIGHKLRDGRQEGLECDGIGRFELPTGVGRRRRRSNRIRKRWEGQWKSGPKGMVVNARLEWGPARLVSIAWLLAGSRAVNNCARHLVWITFAALCCQPRAVGPSWGKSAGRGGTVPFVRSCQVGGFQPLALSVPAAWWAAWMDGGAGAGLEKKSWTRAVNAGNCQAKVGRVSAEDAQ